MNKYWHVLNIGIPSTLVYRVNFLFRAVFALVPLTATIYLWRAVYESIKGNDRSTGFRLLLRCGTCHICGCELPAAFLAG